MQCPITLDVMRDLVTVADGRIYERSAIEAHFRTGKSTSPMTNEPLPSLQLVPDRELRRRCQEFERKPGARRRLRAQRGAQGRAAR